MNTLEKFVREAHRRSVWQVLGVYLVTSWGVLQVVDAVTDSAGLPDWTPGLAFVLLLIGLPVVMATAIVQGRGPRLSAETSSAAGEDESPGPQSGGPSGAEAAPRAAVPDRPAAGPSKLARLFTWKRAIWGGVAAGVLLVVAAGAYLLMWSTGVGPVGNLVAQGLIEEGATVVLADFESGDGTVGDVVTDALRVDLSASPLLNVVPPAQLGSALGRMGLGADAEITPEVAREIAVRDGYATYLTGSASPVGSGYVLTAQIIGTDTGDVLASFRSSAENEEELLPAIDRLSQDIREKAGESLRSIRTGEPLEVVTTSSLRALELYGRALDLTDAGAEVDAIPLLEEAIEIDPEFAMAHRKLSVVLSNNQLDPERADSAAARAYRLRDRLTEREQGIAEAYYFSSVLDDPERSSRAYERVLERYPDDLTALHNLGVNAFSWGDYETAEDVFERVVFGPFPIPTGYDNLARTYASLGRFDEALAVLDSADARFYLSRTDTRMGVRALQRDWEGAHALAEDWVTEIAGSTFDQVQRLTSMAVYDLARGEWREAMVHLDDAEEIAVAAEEWTLYLAWPALTRSRAWFGTRGDRERAREILLEGIRRVPGTWMTPNLNSIFVASSLALFGAAEEAEEGMAAYREQFPDTRGRGFQYADANYRAHLALGRGDADRAVQYFRTVFERLWPCDPACADKIQYALALESVGRTDDAIEALEGQLDRWILGVEGAVVPLEPLALDRLGHLYEARGDTEAAADAYRRLLNRWSDPDPELAPVVENARARIAELTAGGS